MELWDIYDINRNKTRRKHKRGVPLSAGDYHLVVHVWLVNKKGEILLTKRQQNKPHPNLWECPGGSVLAGENSLEGAIREVKEEIGIDLSKCNGKLIKSERRDVFNDFYDAWLFNQSVEITDITLQQEEVSDVKWVTKSELEHIYKSNNLVPTLSYFKILYH
ncbi:DNA mismatch repair protein MutT [Bacillus canaveralius]|uniref:DNA mismatch repair protein MutT n=1 Tax=Bacillus canaveralius TaxID=1403243 RepID=A0A2N5GHS3_9BACI|nr:NUDIX domain-containing protein [Bacillus canaveralius]PLR80342.1 DNA mismatch repair protein MutT [Bacillus canaveralius]PLR95439.1 DNA mismatch repair protein MutT [Bacillus canaveralius]